jgi:hypothetical protein
MERRYSHIFSRRDFDANANFLARCAMTREKQKRFDFAGRSIRDFSDADLLQ